MRETPPEPRLERLLAITPLVSAFLLVFCFAAWRGSLHGSPWLFSDEIEYTQLSRSIAETGEAARRGEPHTAISLYSYLLAPVWWISDTGTAYAAAKYLGALVMSSAIFPVYALARLLVPRGPALFAAVAAVAVPALAYSRLLVTETLAYPYACLCFFLMVKALATWRLRWLAAATLAVLVAPYVRGELGILRPGLVVSAAIALWLGEWARVRRASWTRGEWALVVLLLVATVALANDLAKRVSAYWADATALGDRMLEFATWSSGALAIGIGVLPFVAGLAALARPRDHSLPAYRAFLGVFLSSIALFVTYTMVKATFLSTVFANIIAERNLIYLAPLFFVGTALALHRPQVRVLPLAAAAALTAYLVVETPFQLALYPYVEAPGLTILAEANRTLSLDDPSIESILLWILVGSVVLLLAATVIARRAPRVVQGAFAVVAVAAVAWGLVGQLSFGNGMNDLGNRLGAAVPQPRDWIDRATGGEPALYLGQSIADANPIWVMEFWNRSLRHIGSLDSTAPAPGPVVTPTPDRPDGSVTNDPGVRWVVAEAGVDVAGRLVEQTGAWRLIRLDGPLRLRSAVTGIYPDGWMGAASAYSRFRAEPARGGFMRVTVGRTAWGGTDVPAKVTIRVGSIRIVSFRQPQIGKRVAVCRWTAHSRIQKEFRIPVSGPPVRVETTVDPTFSPTDFGEGDLRQLGVQVNYEYVPGRRATLTDGCS